MSRERKIIIIAGPNGAGETTFARQFLPQEADCPTFINADLIAASPSESTRSACELAGFTAGLRPIPGIIGSMKNGQDDHASRINAVEDGIRKTRNDSHTHMPIPDREQLRKLLDLVERRVNCCKELLTSPRRRSSYHHYAPAKSRPTARRKMTGSDISAGAPLRALRPG